MLITTGNNTMSNYSWFTVSVSDICILCLYILAILVIYYN